MNELAKILSRETEIIQLFKQDIYTLLDPLAMKSFEKEIFATKRRINQAVTSITRMRFPGMKLGLAQKPTASKTSEEGKTEEEEEEDKYKIQDVFNQTFEDTDSPIKSE